jgi:hypothetical protein
VPRDESGKHASLYHNGEWVENLLHGLNNVEGEGVLIIAFVAFSDHVLPNFGPVPSIRIRSRLLSEIFNIRAASLVVRRHGVNAMTPSFFLLFARQFRISRRAAPLQLSERKTKNRSARKPKRFTQIASICIRPL